LESLPGGWDAIVVESSIYQPVHVLLPASAPYFLMTQEALLTMADKLAPGGTLILEFTRTADDSKRSDFAFRAAKGLEDAGLEVYLVASGIKVNLFLMACEGTGCIEKRSRRFSDALGLPSFDIHSQDLPPPLTDDRPFLAWEQLGKSDWTYIQSLAWFFFLGACAVMVRERRKPLAQGEWATAAPFVFAVGIGHIALQVHAFHIARTFFTDSVRTILVMIVLFAAWGAIGSVLTPKFSAALRQKASWAIPVAVALLLAHWVLLYNLPFEDSRVWIRWTAAILATAPGGIFMGMMLPLGLERATARQLPGLIAVDAAGTLAGYALIYPVMLPFGARAYGLVAVVAYLVAVFLLEPTRGTER
jgi:hypothetical protein